MSYRNAWGYLRELEKAAGFKFVERSSGGNRRQGMQLTAPGREFLACYRKFQRGLDAAAQRQFERSFRGKAFRTGAGSSDGSAASRSRTRRRADGK